MIDFHAHVLPTMDDGSRDIAESIAMLQALQHQDIDTVVAAPHFYREQNDVAAFLKRRETSCAQLSAGLHQQANLPHIILGAEVAFYNELYKLEDLEQLCIGGTNYLLIELPFEKWTRRTYDGLYAMIASRGITPIIAHIERYLKIQDDFKKIEQLAALDVLIQMNSSFVNGFFTKKKALQLFKTGMAHVLGSDCHNMTTRPPVIGQAYTKIATALGASCLQKIDQTGRKVLG